MQEEASCWHRLHYLCERRQLWKRLLKIWLPSSVCANPLGGECVGEPEFEHYPDYSLTSITAQVSTWFSSLLFFYLFFLSSYMSCTCKSHGSSWTHTLFIQERFSCPTSSTSYRGEVKEGGQEDRRKYSERTYTSLLTLQTEELFFFKFLTECCLNVCPWDGDVSSWAGGIFYLQQPECILCLTHKTLITICVNV